MNRKHKQLSLQLNNLRFQSPSAEVERSSSICAFPTDSIIHKVSELLFFGGHFGATDLDSLQSSGTR